MKTRTLFLLLLAGLMVGPAEARIKLVALPDRARTVVSLAHPGSTLVEEERVIPLQQGANAIDFSWSGVGIDADSIQVRVLGTTNVVLLNTSFPPNEQSLIWELSSPAAKEERVRITYLLSGVNRDVVYKAVAAPDEKSLTLRTYLRLRNDSGEDLVDAELALGFGADLKKSIAHEEVLEMQVGRTEGVPVRKVLNWDSQAQAWDPEYEKNTVGLPLTYVMTNSAAGHLGLFTLPYGKARIFIKTKDASADAGGETTDGVAFTGEDWVQLAPVDREVKLTIGQSRDVKVTQRQVKNDRINIRRNTSNQEVVWDTEEEFRIEVENFKKTPVDLVVTQHVPGYWKLDSSSHPFTKKDAFTFQFPLTLAQGTTGTNKTVVTFKLNRLNVQGNEPQNY
jgi:hypothetical protein